MSKITIDKNDIPSRGWLAINDCACGAGALLIAARNDLAEKGIGYRQALFVCQDIDHVAGLMCYIQLSLLGCAGYVVIADTICSPLCMRSSPLLPIIKADQEFWFMPMIYDEVWQGRIVWENAMLAVGLLDNKKAETAEKPHVEQVKQIDEHEQLRLF